jgi:hypothetical protein
MQNNASTILFQREIMAKGIVTGSRLHFIDYVQSMWAWNSVTPVRPQLCKSYSISSRHLPSLYKNPSTVMDNMIGLNQRATSVEVGKLQLPCWCIYFAHDDCWSILRYYYSIIIVYKQFEMICPFQMIDWVEHHHFRDVCATDEPPIPIETVCLRPLS